ncbi:MAG: phasin family protein [Chloroflexota bacterium]|jgi:hypothetical protein
MTMETMQDSIVEMEEERRSLAGRVAGVSRRYFNAGIGAVSAALEKASDFRHETIEKRIDRLAERGQNVRDRRMSRLSETAESTRDMTVGFTRQVADITGSTLNSVANTTRDRLHLASAEDIESVSQQIDQLSRKIDNIDLSAAEEVTSPDAI